MARNKHRLDLRTSSEITYGSFYSSYDRRFDQVVWHWCPSTLQQRRAQGTLNVA